MAVNPYVNKVVYNNSTLIDLTEDTITPESLLSGYTAHDRSGSPINGAAVIPTKVSDLENDVDYLVETDIVNNLTSTATDKPLSANMGKQLNDNKPNKSLQAITDANDSTLFGTRLLQDTACSNLPTSNGNYYQVFFYGPFQIAIHFTTNGTDALYVRYYANNQWYPWALCGGQTTKNDITGAASGVTTNGYYIYSKSTGTVRIYLTANSSSDISTDTVLGAIPTGYRPSSTTKLPGTITTSNGSTLSYFGEIATNGNITQKLSASARSVVLFGEYAI